MNLTPEPAATVPASRSDQSAAGRRRAELLEQLIEMRRDEAAAEDAEDFGWAEDLRAHPFPTHDDQRTGGK